MPAQEAEPGRTGDDRRRRRRRRRAPSILPSRPMSKMPARSENRPASAVKISGIESRIVELENADEDFIDNPSVRSLHGRFELAE